MTFIRNSWYAAAWAHELNAGPLGRRMLNEPVVVYRADGGQIVALRDVCPHRAVPLSLGSVHGDRIRCAYHALEFDAAGVCRRNPHIKGPPDRLRVKSYPAAQKYGAIWVWFGDPELADPLAIPSYEWFDSPERYTVGHGYTLVHADYRLIIDNLLDLAHAEYLHPDTVGSPGAAQVEVAEIVRDDEGIAVHTLWPDLPPSAVFKAAWTKSERVDQFQNMKWRRASNLLLDLGIHPPGAPKSEGWHVPSAHILTPQTETSTHYFWAFARDFALGDADVTAAIIHMGGVAFGDEDKPIIEAAQRSFDLTSCSLTDFTIGDRGSSAVRREIDRLIREEAIGEAERGTGQTRVRA
ncbi:MAG: aromatic ring-hydroxylating dioxygenase subunit alpha [Alphaproteobacteria bacterium]|nr:aromatic ring-hydroxylating dioxygenase subunit alpha [Alphaproteobacteria bacterium]